MKRALIILFLLALAAMPTARAQIVPAELAAQQLSLPADLIKPAVVGISSGRSGKGLVVGYRGGEWLIATAAHVVEPVGDDELVNVGIFVDDGQVVQVSGRVLHRIDAPTDLAFLSVTAPADLALPVYGVIETLPLVTYVVNLGGASEWRVPRLAGILTSLGVADTLRMEGTPVERGYSGGPAIGPGGVVGLIVRQQGPDTADVLAIAAVRREFEKLLAPSGWRWIPRLLPPAPAVGSIRLTRLDNLGGYLSLTPATGQQLIPTSGQLMMLPAGHYSLKALSAGGNELDCDPDQVTVLAGGSYEASVTCRLEIAGRWILPDGTLELQPLGSGRYNAVLSGNQLLSGQGSASFDGSFLVLNINRLSGDSWSARLRVTPDSMTGEITEASWYLGSDPFKLFFWKRR